VAAAPAGLVLALVLGAGWRLTLLAAALAPAAVLVWQVRHRGEHGTWAKGARGERKTARMLRPLERAGYTVLHDRALPSSRANVDHLVIGETGVYVVDSKNWSKQRIVAGRGRRVRVGRTYGSTVVRGTDYEIRAVSNALAYDVGQGVPVAGLLAVHGAKLPPWRIVDVNGIPLLPARQVRRFIARQPRTLTPDEVARISASAKRLFPPYTA
jgi:hypothetical protein